MFLYYFRYQYLNCILMDVYNTFTLSFYSLRQTDKGLHAYANIDTQF